MAEIVDVHPGLSLADYESYAHLVSAVQQLRAEAATVLPRLKGRKLWMVNSTAQGGGVAEMLPRMIGLLRELGVEAEWAVIGTKRMEFFDLTKRLHNMIHGAGEARIDAADRELYDTVSRENAAELRKHVRPEDILIIHDPQPAGTGMILKEAGNIAIWRCHIGLDERNDATRTAWKFLKPATDGYDHAVFSAPEYIPDFLAGRASVIHPAIDPLTHKNRDLTSRALAGILCNAGLAQQHHPVLTPSFPERAKRLRPDGSFVEDGEGHGIGLMYRPLILQVSRWDRLKGFGPLMAAFPKLKAMTTHDPMQKRRLELLRLVLAGPDPDSIQDDPEGVEVLEGLKKAYAGLPRELQEEVAVISLPMASVKVNALMVNAMQRCASVVVQNSIREGFGLTVTEAMWKRTAVLGTQACGIRQQIRDGIDGRLAPDPENVEGLAGLLNEMLLQRRERHIWGRNAQRRVHSEFLIFSQLCKWLRLLGELV